MNKKVVEVLRYCLAGIIIFCFFALLYMVISKPIPDVNQRLADIVIGALIGAFTTVVGYYFGSSSGSAEKTKLLSEKGEQG